MSPEEAKVFFVEDDANNRKVSAEFLEMAGHTVIEKASSLPEALAKIPSLGKKGVNVAIVDGNLSERDTSGRDGEKVAGEIKAKHPNIIVVGHSLEKLVSVADVNCTKMQGSSKLADVVTRA